VPQRQAMARAAEGEGTEPPASAVPAKAAPSARRVKPRRETKVSLVATITRR